MTETITLRFKDGEVRTYELIATTEHFWMVEQQDGERDTIKVYKDEAVEVRP